MLAIRPAGQIGFVSQDHAIERNSFPIKDFRQFRPVELALFRRVHLWSFLRSTASSLPPSPGDLALFRRTDRVRSDVVRRFCGEGVLAVVFFPRLALFRMLRSQAKPTDTRLSVLPRWPIFPRFGFVSHTPVIPTARFRPNSHSPIRNPQSKGPPLAFLAFRQQPARRANRRQTIRVGLSGSSIKLPIHKTL